MMTARRVHLIDLVEQGQKEAVQKLIASGNCDVDETNDSGNCAVMMCVQRNNKDILEILITAEANVDVKDGLGRSAISRAKQLKHNEVAKLIEEALSQKKITASSPQGSHDQRMFGKTLKIYTEESKESSPTSSITNESGIVVSPIRGR